MIIDFEMTEEEFLWVCQMACKIYKIGRKVERIYRDDQGNISIALEKIVLSES